MSEQIHQLLRKYYPNQHQDLQGLDVAALGGFIAGAIQAIVNGEVKSNILPEEANTDMKMVSDILRKLAGVTESTPAEKTEPKTEAAEKLPTLIETLEAEEMAILRKLASRIGVSVPRNVTQTGLANLIISRAKDVKMDAAQALTQLKEEEMAPKTVQLTEALIGDMDVDSAKDILRGLFRSQDHTTLLKTVLQHTPPQVSLNAIIKDMAVTIEVGGEKAAATVAAPPEPPTPPEEANLHEDPKPAAKANGKTAPFCPECKTRMAIKGQWWVCPAPCGIAIDRKTGVRHDPEAQAAKQQARIEAKAEKKAERAADRTAGRATKELQATGKIAQGTKVVLSWVPDDCVVRAIAQIKDEQVTVTAPAGAIRKAIAGDVEPQSDTGKRFLELLRKYASVTYFKA